MNTFYRALGAMALLLLMAGPLHAQDTTETMQDTTLQEADTGTTVVAVIRESPDHQTLARALEAAGLIRALQEEGPYTIFAPTDSAFALLPEGTLDSLLAPESRERLRAILRYHIVTDDVTAADAAGLSRAVTVQGDTLSISAEGAALMVDNATVIEADLSASNGIVHTIDAVLMPPSATVMEEEMDVEDEVMEEDTMMMEDTTEEDTLDADTTGSGSASYERR